MAAPKNNSNRFVHGLRMKLSKLPREAKSIENDLFALRRLIEDVVAAVHGEIDLVQAMTINTILRCEKRALLCERWLRMGGENASLENRLALARDITAASAARDKAVEALGIKGKHERFVFPSEATTSEPGQTFEQNPNVGSASS